MRAGNLIITALHFRQVERREAAERDLHVVAETVRDYIDIMREQQLTIDVLRRQVADGAGAEAHTEARSTRSQADKRNP